MSRRDQVRMNDEERRAFLDQSLTIIISSIGRDGAPHPIPMWYAIEDDGAIVMSTYTKSQKIRNLRRDPRVSLLVEDGTAYSELRGILMYGVAELIQDVERVADILMVVSSRQGGAEADDLRPQMRQSAEKRTGIRVRLNKIVSWDHRKLGDVY